MRVTSPPDLGTGFIVPSSRQAELRGSECGRGRGRGLEREGEREQHRR